MSPNSKRVVIIGGGPAGLSAAYTLKKRGISPLLFEASDRVGGRLSGEEVDGFHIDTGADFFCSSYDVTIRLCEELGISLLPSKMSLGWYKNGRWVTTTPGLSIRNLLKNLQAASSLGLMSPKGALPTMKVFGSVIRQSEYLSFASDSKLGELDGNESFGEYLERVGAPNSLKATLQGFLEMTMGHVEYSGQAYMRTYLAEMLLKSDQIYVPKKGAAALSNMLADSCSDAIHLSTPVRRVMIRDSAVAAVALDDDTIEADAVICAVPAPKVPEIIPDLPSDILQPLRKVTYSTGCRVVIGLDHPPLPRGWHGALYPEDDTPLLLDRSINLQSCAPPGKSTLDLLVGRDRAEELLPLDDDEIKRQMLRDARRNPPPGSNLPDDDEGLFTRVYRWKEAVCMGRPGMFTAVADARQKLSGEISNLFLAGDYTKVPSVNGAVASGISAAEDIADQLASN